MMYAGRLLLSVLVVVSSSTGLPNHLKTVSLDVVPVVQGTSVSASYGGYSAKAGLGGSTGGQGPAGGLFAAAESPLGSAAAGLGGSSATYVDHGAAASQVGGTHAGPAPPHKPQHQGPTGFDGIFNIPISVLQAVNTYLNNRGPVTKPVHRRRGHRPRPVHEDEEVVYKTVTPVKDEPSAAVGEVEDLPASGAAPSQGATTGTHPVIHKRVNYDDIFNIPISALKSVNQLLNGKK